MPDAKKSSDVLTAHEAVYKALLPLEAEDRQKVLASVCALLDITTSNLPVRSPVGSPPVLPGAPSSPREPATRPLSLVELMQEKHPGTNDQRITLFAYYRDRHEGKSRFSREDLKEYFGKAKEPPPGNYDRDFTRAVKQGWIHEDGSDSYITSKGIETVEAGFTGARKYTRSAKVRSRGR